MPCNFTISTGETSKVLSRESCGTTVQRRLSVGFECGWPSWTGGLTDWLTDWLVGMTIHTNRAGDGLPVWSGQGNHRRSLLRTFFLVGFALQTLIIQPPFFSLSLIGHDRNWLGSKGLKSVLHVFIHAFCVISPSIYVCPHAYTLISSTSSSL